MEINMLDLISFDFLNVIHASFKCWQCSNYLGNKKMSPTFAGHEFPQTDSVDLGKALKSPPPHPVSCASGLGSMDIIMPGAYDYPSCDVICKLHGQTGQMGTEQSVCAIVWFQLQCQPIYFMAPTCC